MTLLMCGRYGTAPDTMALCPPWGDEQEPDYAVPGTQRISVVESAEMPGTGPWCPPGRGMRVELRPFSATTPGSATPADGDVQNSSGYLANRAEVAGRLPQGSLGSVPPQSWPDPVDSVRWYSWALLVPAGFPVTTSGTQWLTCTQWKGLYGGSPPLGIEIKRSSLRLGGTRTNQGLIPGDGIMGPLTPGVWARITVGMRWSPDPSAGWVTAYLNGRRVIPKTVVATMDYRAGTALPDPVYLKQGIYRDTAWPVPQTLYFGPLAVGETIADLDGC